MHTSEGVDLSVVLQSVSPTPEGLPIKNGDDHSNERRFVTERGLCSAYDVLDGLELSNPTEFLCMSRLDQSVPLSLSVYLSLFISLSLPAPLHSLSPSLTCMQTKQIQEG